MIRIPIPLLLLAPPLALAATVTPPVAILETGALKPGQKAEVRTVFKGDSIESFEAEILGVLRGGRAEGDMILARATSGPVMRTGVAQGMSGSPVYVDGRLVGALSSGWSFSREPTFGVTPIREMLDVLDLPTSKVGPGTAGPTGIDLPAAAGSPRFRELCWDGAAAAPETPAPGETAGPSPLALPLACGGLDPAARELAARWLAPLGLTVVPGGRSAGDGPGPASLAPGSALAVDVMRGDLPLSASGA